MPTNRPTIAEFKRLSNLASEGNQEVRDFLSHPIYGARQGLKLLAEAGDEEATKKLMHFRARDSAAQRKYLGRLEGIRRSAVGGSDQENARQTSVLSSARSTIGGRVAKQLGRRIGSSMRSRKCRRIGKQRKSSSFAFGKSFSSK
jgi:hypothetical protein